jgi:hypothetical protein
MSYRNITEEFVNCLVVKNINVLGTLILLKLSLYL